MKLRPGCGCLVLVLAFFNLLLSALAIIGLVRKTLGASGLSVAMLLVFVANAVVLVMVGWAAFRQRQQPPNQTAPGSEGEGVDEGSDE